MRVISRVAGCSAPVQGLGLVPVCTSLRLRGQACPSPSPVSPGLAPSGLMTTPRLSPISRRLFGVRAARYPMTVVRRIELLRRAARRAPDSGRLTIRAWGGTRANRSRSEGLRRSTWNLGESTPAARGALPREHKAHKPSVSSSVTRHRIKHPELETVLRVAPACGGRRCSRKKLASSPGG